MKKRFVTTIFAAAMMVSAIGTGVTPVFAEEAENYTIEAETENKNADVLVTATVDSTFKVLIPKTVTLAKEDDTIHYGANYSVKVVDADIRPDQSLDISVPQTITMTEETLGEEKAQTIKNVKVAEDGAISSVDKVSVGMDIAEATFNFKACEMNDDLTAYVDTDTVFTAGSWSGTQTFTVALTDVVTE